MVALGVMSTKSTPLSGAKLKAEREKRGWSQAHLARLADVAPATISSIEAGKTHGRFVAHLLAEALGVEVDTLREERAPEVVALEAENAQLRRELAEIKSNNMETI